VSWINWRSPFQSSRTVWVLCLHFLTLPNAVEEVDYEQDLEWTTPINPGHGNWPGKIPAVQRWAYDYGKDGEEFIPQIMPLKEGEHDGGH
ncbi:MAG: hypothetical protein AAFY48_25960, partial [Bacteroidota bacterium]